MIEDPVEIKVFNITKKQKFYIVVIFVIFIELLAFYLLLLRKDNINEQASNAQRLLFNILEAQDQYNAQNGIYADSLSRLVDSGLLAEQKLRTISKNGESGEIDGYRFYQISWGATKWRVESLPINGDTMVYSVDAFGINLFYKSIYDRLEEIQKAQKEFIKKNKRFAHSLSELQRQGFLEDKQYLKCYKDGDKINITGDEITQVFCKDDSFEITCGDTNVTAKVNEKGIVRAIDRDSD